MSLLDMEVGFKAEDLKEILFYLDPYIRSSVGECDDQIVKVLQDGEGGHYRMVTSIRTRLREVMGEMVRSKIRDAVKVVD